MFVFQISGKRFECYGCHTVIHFRRSSCIGMNTNIWTVWSFSIRLNESTAKLCAKKKYIHMYIIKILKSSERLKKGLSAYLGNLAKTRSCINFYKSINIYIYFLSGRKLRAGKKSVCQQFGIFFHKLFFFSEYLCRFLCSTDVCWCQREHFRYISFIWP